MLSTLFTAFSLGLFGSLHCAGMCGPLMWAAGGDWRGVMAYQAGRLLTYALLGGLLGGLGVGLQLLHLQATFSLLCGALLVALAIGRSDPAGWLSRHVPLYVRWQLALRHRWAGWVRGGGPGARFGLGCCNGLLPCGLVYLAVIGAAQTTGAAAGAAFMLAFGAGTLPLLVGLLLTGRRLLGRWSAALLRYTPLVVGLCGLWLLWRGWQAEIPVDLLRFRDLAFPPMCQ
ncbi:sulfite exporter TauE/SafE family protein [Lewinella sp. IMCC34183]|uniref:sulfite exporter TauE/SafE family protein n=1 Tax=Lewinella sp. IMCC34183 TaxID=2248762 RepID=UPI000E2425A2|nr:sulfite exporter TauE/SafE family protein [Lewinella sp. IMCC34183]